MTRRDVQLVISAKQDASRAIETVVGTLNDLFGIQTKVGQSAENTADLLSNLGSALLTLDKAYTKIDGAATGAAAAFERQQRSISETKAQYDAVRAQADGAAAALARLKVQADAAFVGPPQNNLSTQIKQIESAQSQLEGQARRLTTSLTEQESAFERSRASMQQIGSTAISAEDAISRVRAATELESQALREQTDAAARAAASQARFNSISAPGLSNESKSAEEAASILAVTAARDAEIQKLKQQEAATTALSVAEEEQRRINRTLGVSDTPAYSARESAAGFQEINANKLKEEAAAARESDAALRAAADAAAEMDAKVAALKEQIDPLAAIQARLNSELTEARAMYAAGRLSAQELAAAEKLLATNADNAAKALGRTSLAGGTKALFGLRPYELTNLGYQINDVVTQIASGTKISQVLAQQGGQILQLFPRLGASVIALLPQMAAFGAVVGTIALGLNRLASDAELVRSFTAQLGASADGAQYQADALAKATRALDNYGVSAADAQKVVRTFVKDGVNPALIEPFTRSAKDLADVLGVDVKDAANQLGEGFTAGYKAIAKLDDATNFLTASEREHIKALFDSGDAETARAEAFTIFSQKFDDAATKMRGPWSTATRELATAWNSLLDSFAKTGFIQAASGFLDDLAESASRVADSISGTTSIGTLDLQIKGLSKTLAALKANVAEMGDPLGLKQFDLNDLESRIKKLQAQRAALAKAPASVAGIDPQATATQRQKKIDDDIALADQKKLAAAKQLTNEQRIQTAYETAYNAALDKGASTEGARASAQAAANIERAKAEKQITTEKQKQARADEQTIKGFAQKAIGAQTGSDNPASADLGAGQFVAETWLHLFKRTYPDIAKGLTDDAILALRKNLELNKSLIEVYANDNAAILKKAGIAITDANLYITQTLGADNGKKLIQAAPGMSADKLFGADVLNAHKNVFFDNGRTRTAGEAQSVLGGQIGDSSSAQARGAQIVTKAIQDSEQAQSKFNAQLDDANEKSKANAQLLSDQTGLIGEQLIAEQKKQAIADALLKTQQDIDKINADLIAKGEQQITLSEDQKKAVEDTTAALFDQQHARDIAQAKRTAVDQPVADLTDTRNSVMQQIDFFQQNGQAGLAGQLEDQLTGINARLDEAVKKALAFWEAMKGDPEATGELGLTSDQVDNIILKLNTASSSATNLGTQFIQTGRQLNESFAQGGVSALDQFAQSVASGANAVDSLKDAFLQFASNFLLQIGNMIAQQAIFNAIGGASGSGAGGLGGTISSFVSSLFHEGGIAGVNGQSRAVSPAVFMNAPRFHGGGLPGLKSNEVATILEKGEEVLTADDPRHVGNGGTNRQGASSVKIINQFDPGEMFQKGLSSKAGEKAILNYVSENQDAFRAAIGG